MRWPFRRRRADLAIAGTLRAEVETPEQRIEALVRSIDRHADELGRLYLEFNRHWLELMDAFARAERPRPETPALPPPSHARQ